METGNLPIVSLNIIMNLSEFLFIYGYAIHDSFSSGNHAIA